MTPAPSPRRVRRILGLVSALLPKRELTDPVFIIGCGRSGTTILGNTIAQHPQVTYLNEPRHLWCRVFPETDIWSEWSVARAGKLVLDDRHADNWRSRWLRQLFFHEADKSGKPRLVEKLPINSFRLHFLRAIFPEARFVHIYRNGLEVARSIDRSSQRGGWFGSETRKWELLVEHSQTRSETAALPALCRDFFDQGLLEWRLSVTAAVEFLETLPVQQSLELSYRNLTNQPVDTLRRVIEFIGLEPNDSVDTFARTQISRRTQPIDAFVPTPPQATLGGDLLLRSMEDRHRGLTRGHNPERSAEVDRDQRASGDEIGA